MTDKQQLWYARYLDFIESGLSQRQWCKNNHISTSSFAYWVKTFNHENEAIQTEADNMWVEVRETAPAAKPSSASAEPSAIRIALGELKIELSAYINPGCLIKLIEGLSGR